MQSVDRRTAFLVGEREDQPSCGRIGFCAVEYSIHGQIEKQNEVPPARFLAWLYEFTRARISGAAMPVAAKMTEEGSS